MFGYIKPQISELKVKEYELYRAVYCGLCAALGRNATCAGRLSLSYDFVFLAVVRMSLAGEVGEIKKKHCIAHPTKKRAVLYGAEQLDYSARASAVLTYHKLRDDIHDDKGLKRLGARILLPFASMMRKKAKPDPVMEAVIAEKLAELASLEDAKCADIDAVAEPFGELMAHVCAWGFSPDGAEYRIAREIGRHIGRFVYVIDAVDDLEGDMRSGAYNPFKMMYGDPIAELADNRERLKTSLNMELVGIERAVMLMDTSKVPEYGEIIKNIIYLGLPSLADKILDKYTAKAVDGE